MSNGIDISLTRMVPAAVIRSGVQRVFVNRLRRANKHVKNIVVISPWITAEKEGPCPFTSLLHLLRSRKIVAYFFTRRPATPDHVSAIDMLRQCETAEIVYNDNIHAKILACTAPQPHGFALLGSANLTAHSLVMYEIGLLVIGVGSGSAIVQDLANFGLQHLRTRKESEVVKKINLRGLMK